MEAECESIAIALGKHAAMRMFMREDPSETDLEEVLAQAETALDAALDELGAPPDAPLREQTLALMAESYKAELVRLRECG